MKLSRAIGGLNGGQLLWVPRNEATQDCVTPIGVTTPAADKVLYGIRRATPYGASIKLECAWHALPVEHEEMGWCWQLDGYHQVAVTLIVDPIGSFQFVGRGLFTLHQRMAYHLLPSVGGLVALSDLIVPRHLSQSFEQLSQEHLAPAV